MHRLPDKPKHHVYIIELYITWNEKRVLVWKVGFTARNGNIRFRELSQQHRTDIKVLSLEPCDCRVPQPYPCKREQLIHKQWNSHALQPGYEDDQGRHIPLGEYFFPWDTRQQIKTLTRIIPQWEEEADAIGYEEEFGMYTFEHGDYPE